MDSEQHSTYPRTNQQDEKRKTPGKHTGQSPRRILAYIQQPLRRSHTLFYSPTETIPVGTWVDVVEVFEPQIGPIEYVDQRLQEFRPTNSPPRFSSTDRRARLVEVRGPDVIPSQSNKE